MKTLIFNGSPRINGDTANLINCVISNLNGEYKIVNAYFDNISLVLIADIVGKRMAVLLTTRCIKYTHILRNVTT